eukprot:jgi/Psemu1/53575/gm1.53575_g
MNTQNDESFKIPEDLQQLEEELTAQLDHTVQIIHQENMPAITAKQGEPFKAVNSSLNDDPDSLKISLSLRQRLSHTEVVWKSADLLNPCHILYPIKDSTNQAKLKYYAKFVQFPITNNQEGTFSCELEWSYNYFRNNTKLRLLYETVQKEFATYDHLEQGGPLFLKLLLDHLIISNNASEAALIDTAKNYNIQQSSDEDILVVTKLVSFITDMIVAIWDHKEHKLPDNYLQSLTKVLYQTASFAALQKTIIESNSMAGSITTMENTPSYCDLATNVWETSVCPNVDNCSSMAANQSPDKTSGVKNSHKKCGPCGKEGCETFLKEVGMASSQLWQRIQTHKDDIPPSGLTAQQQMLLPVPPAKIPDDNTCVASNNTMFTQADVEQFQLDLANLRMTSLLFLVLDHFFSNAHLNQQWILTLCMTLVAARAAAILILISLFISYSHIQASSSKHTKYWPRILSFQHSRCRPYQLCQYWSPPLASSPLCTIQGSRRHSARLRGSHALSARLRGSRRRPPPFCVPQLQVNGSIPDEQLRGFNEPTLRYFDSYSSEFNVCYFDCSSAPSEHYFDSVYYNDLPRTTSPLREPPLLLREPPAFKHDDPDPITTLLNSIDMIQHATSSLSANRLHYNYQCTIPLRDPLLVYLSSNVTELPIVINSGASCTIISTISDFTDQITKSKCTTSLTQSRGKAAVIGEGTITWNIEDIKKGTRCQIHTKAYYVPSATIRLFSPQAYTNNDPTAQLLLNNRGSFFTLKCSSTLHFPTTSSSFNLPFMLTKTAVAQSKLLSRTTSICTPPKRNFSYGTAAWATLTSSAFNCCFENHIHLKDPPLKARSHAPAVLSHPAKRDDHPVAGHQHVKPSSCAEYQEGSLIKGQLEPGNCVSCDQYMSTTLCRLSYTLGKEDKHHLLAGGTMFILDHTTNDMFHCHQVNLTVAESLRSKHVFESHMNDCGIRVRHFASDNRLISAKAWISNCITQQQQHSLSGVRAHHQKYVEQHLQTIFFNWARASLLLHVVLHWPQQASKKLLPFAIDYSVYIWNNRTHVFGCPVVVLDLKLQDSKKLPKWTMCSCRGIYLGLSPSHSSTVNLVLNPATGAITPNPDAEGIIRSPPNVTPFDAPSIQPELVPSTSAELMPSTGTSSPFAALPPLSPLYMRVSPPTSLPVQSVQLLSSEESSSSCLSNCQPRHPHQFPLQLHSFGGALPVPQQPVSHQNY